MVIPVVGRKDPADAADHTDRRPHGRCFCQEGKLPRPGWWNQ